MDQVVGSASKINPCDEEDIIQTGTIVKACKDFFFASVGKYYFLNAVINAVGIFMVWTMDHYGELLWFGSCITFDWSNSIPKIWETRLGHSSSKCTPFF